MKPLINDQFNFFADVNPPMDVVIRMKSTDRFCEGPKIWTLRSESRATIEEHLEDLGGRYDLWQLASIEKKAVDEIKIIINGVEHEFKGDELTSPIHDAQAFLSLEMEKEMEF